MPFEGIDSAGKDWSVEKAAANVDENAFVQTWSDLVKGTNMPRLDRPSMPAELSLTDPFELSTEKFKGEQLNTGDVLSRGLFGPSLQMPNGETLDFGKKGWTLVDASGKSIIDAVEASKKLLDGGDKMALENGVSLQYMKNLQEWILKYPNGDELSIAPMTMDSRQINPSSAEAIRGNQVHVFRNNSSQHVEFLTVGSRAYVGVQSK